MCPYEDTTMVWSAADKKLPIAKAGITHRSLRLKLEPPRVPEHFGASGPSKLDDSVASSLTICEMWLMMKGSEGHGAT